MPDTLITQKRLEADGIVSLRLRGLDGALPAFEPGAHVDLEVAEGLLRQYSLCGRDEAANEYEIAVLREPESRGGSAKVHEVLQVGQTVRISDPRNLFPLHPANGGKALLFAGGIGITPILAMAEHLAAAGAPFELHYCSRSQERMAFRERVRRNLGERAHFHFDDGPSAQQLDLAAVLGRAGAQDQLYVCGPGGFIAAVLAKAGEAGWTEDRLHKEFFSVPEDEAEHGENRPFAVVIASTGQELQVPADRTIVQVLEENGICVPTSCEEGICGTCVVNLLEGEADHRDFLFSEEEHAANTRLTVCCSRAKSARLVLDL